MDSTALLIARKGTRGRDAAGNQVVDDGKTEIFVTEQSATRRDHAAAASNGKRAEFVLTTFYLDYEQQKEIEYNGVVYDIDRAYRSPGSDEVELHLVAKGGANKRE